MEAKSNACPEPEVQRQLARDFRSHFLWDEFGELGGGCGEIYLRGAQSATNNRLLKSMRWRNLPEDLKHQVIEQIRNGRRWWWPDLPEHATLHVVERAHYV